jgi:SAM-dependent methyltransferase
MERYFSGAALYGDELGEEELAAWYADEAEGYADLESRDPSSYRYRYHALNAWHAFRHLPPGRHFSRAMGFGSAYGEEFAPLSRRIGELTIVEPSRAFVREEVCGIPTTYLKPGPFGKLPLADGRFDLITCLGVLHHLPNVSFVIGELARVMRGGGYLVLREPIVSMGDWRKPRPGLTKRERGIPLAILREIAARQRLELVHESLCQFPLSHRLINAVLKGYHSPAAVWLDALCCQALRWNLRYHARTVLQKFRPRAARRANRRFIAFTRRTYTRAS